MVKAKRFFMSGLLGLLILLFLRSGGFGLASAGGLQSSVASASADLHGPSTTATPGCLVTWSSITDLDLTSYNFQLPQVLTLRQWSRRLYAEAQRTQGTNIMVSFSAFSAVSIFLCLRRDL